MFIRLELAGRWWTFNTGKLQPPKPSTPVPVGTSTPMTTVGFMQRRSNLRGGGGAMNPTMTGPEAPTNPDPTRMDTIGGVQ